ncbi:MAG: o-succinylbenzoate synthase [Cyanobacteria bacterium P01_G01_bin.54]
MLQVTLAPYHHPFKQPLQTAHGVWRCREGLIVTLTDASSRQGQGEIAPLPTFGSETLSAAIAYCKALGDRCLRANLEHIPDHLPACQFGFATALQALDNPTPPIQLDIAQVAHLIPLSRAVLPQMQALQAQGATTFKCKIGVQDLAQEMAIWQALSQHALPTTRFRLDANGGLTPALAEQWLALAQARGNVEFLEQPLPPTQFDAMQTLAERFTVPIALDESVAGWADLQQCYRAGWRGVYGLKLAIAGAPQRLIEFCCTHDLDLVCSSVFETAIGRQGALRVAQALKTQRPLGFGVQNWF